MGRTSSPKPKKRVSNEEERMDGTIHTPVEQTPGSPVRDYPGKNRNFFSRIDLQLSSTFHNYVQARPNLKLLATLLTLSADELCVYPLMVLVGFSLFLMGDGHLQLAGRQILRIYGDYGAVCLLEQVLKLVFGRRRPPYLMKSNIVYAMPGEWYSFPSGHSMRAAYGSVVFLLNWETSPYTTLGATWLQTNPEWALGLAVSWSVLVAMSRVAVAKHYITDVIAGLAVGLAVAMSPYPYVNPQGPIRVFLASCFTVEIIAIMLVPKWMKLMPAWPGLLGIVIFFWLGYPIAV